MAGIFLKMFVLGGKGSLQIEFARNTKFGSILVVAVVALNKTLQKSMYNK